MFSVRRVTWLCVVCVGMSALGCSSSDGNADDADGDDANVADFVGRWNVATNSGTNSCSGEYDNPTIFSIELRAGDESDLEFIEFDVVDPSRVTCRQRFEIRGAAAHLDGEQACTYVFPSTDPLTGQDTTLTNHVVFKSDRLELDGSDSLIEEGVSQMVDDLGETCTTNFDITYERD